MFVPGHSPSQDAKCLSLGKRLMSVPISLTIVIAVLTSMPLMRGERPAAPRCPAAEDA
jgi:hypothetical protein